jgi:vacuolar-type H+-ATPase subunit I/STV1
MVELHSGLRWLVLLGAVAAGVGYGRALARKTFDDLAARLGTVYAALLGLQFVVGLVLWVLQQRWSGDNVFLSYIHPLLMILAIAVASAGIARARRARNAAVGLAAVVLSIVIVVTAIPSWS